MDEAMERLFRAKWNVPKAARVIGCTDEECKQLFREYCLAYPAVYNEAGELQSNWHRTRVSPVALCAQRVTVMRGAQKQSGKSSGPDTVPLNQLCRGICP